MNYIIREMEAFSVVGQEIEITNFQRKNIQICTHFWRKFNNNLKRAYLSQHGNWVKYAFMERRNEKLYYYCAIPKRVVVPEGFKSKEITSQKYLVVEHIGAMDKIYDTYSKLYQKIASNTEHILLQDDFLHFERYDYRFHWNKENSVIEIWLPINS